MKTKVGHPHEEKMKGDKQKENIGKHNLAFHRDSAHHIGGVQFVHQPYQNEY